MIESHVPKGDGQRARIGGMTISVEEVTPSMADRWLTADHNAKNRNIRQAIVAKYASDMANEKWVFTHQGIAFDRDGFLLDGQHRLSAIVKSETPQQMFVFRGVDSRARAVVDGGAKRSVQDQITLGDLSCGPVTKEEVAVATKMVAGMSGRVPIVSASTIADWITMHRDAIDFALESMPRRTHVTTSEVRAVVARAWYHGRHSDLERFGRVVCDGIMEYQADSPAVLLRNALIAGRQHHDGSDRSLTRYRRTNRALHAFLNGESLKRLYAARSEYFPLPGEASDD